MRIASHPPRTSWGRGLAGGASARPASRFGHRNRTVAILPAQARVGLLTDCKESSDERRGAEFAVSTGRNRCARGRLPLECTGIGLVRQAGGMLASRSTGLRAMRSSASRSATLIYGGRWVRRVHSSAKATTCSATSFTWRRAVPSGNTRTFASIIRQTVSTWFARTCKRSVRCVALTERFTTSSIARFGRADEAEVERRDARRRSLAGDRSSQPRSVYHRTYGATRGTEPHGLVRCATRKR
ncbi:hypothetical protein BLA39750_00146 [Burkholderia lata]|uniref:Uncharacterized protein n=1 Tax=Burkholderia lata (strain ATCC 17760 / DSM 23089 / LMG 22485 / NCIMB 9086 / R18194 / 383) TaxID=482957 RepID=A0A6P2U6Z7_BURL3|nr:hypothetical protein BLA39750_00146 [Burkholderia lata]